MVIMPMSMTSNMAVPYPNQGHGPKDDFNFFHSQVWINIECAFGILSNHWHIRKNVLSSTLFHQESHCTDKLSLSFT